MANATLARRQRAWIEGELARADADECAYVLVCGHCPLWSVGEHGSTDLLVSWLNPLLIAHRVTAYAAGHDHTSDFFSADGVGYATLTNSFGKRPSILSNITDARMTAKCALLDSTLS